jgi:hypothetical protein
MVTIVRHKDRGYWTTIYLYPKLKRSKGWDSVPWPSCASTSSYTQVTCLHDFQHIHTHPGTINEVRHLSSQVEHLRVSLWLYKLILRTKSRLWKSLESPDAKKYHAARLSSLRHWCWIRPTQLSGCLKLMLLPQAHFVSLSGQYDVSHGFSQSRQPIPLSCIHWKTLLSYHHFE